MEESTKKYLIGAGVLIGGYLVYTRVRQNAKASSTDKKTVPQKKPALPVAPPSTAGQFNPVPNFPPQYPGSYPGYPGVFPQYPQYPQYPVGGYPQYPGQIPQYPQYPGQVPQYPGYPGGYPGGYTPPPVNCQAAAASVIGLSVTVAQQRLSSLGIVGVVSTQSYQAHATSLIGPSVVLYPVGGIVRRAVCHQPSYNPGYQY